MLVLLENYARVQSRIKYKQALYVDVFNATLSAGEYLLQQDGSVGRLLQHCTYDMIPMTERPLNPNNDDDTWLLVHRYSCPAEYPDVAGLVAADHSIIELREYFANNFGV